MAKYVVNKARLARLEKALENAKKEWDWDMVEKIEDAIENMDPDFRAGAEAYEKDHALGLI